MISNSKGVTLLELIVAIAIVGILTSIALPAFDNQIKDSRLVSNSNLVIGAYNLARNEAITRGVAVKVVDTANGWAVEEDASGELINQFEPDSSGITWSPSAFPDVTFNANGFRPFGSTSVSIKLVDSRGKGRTITISPAGSTTVTKIP